jgi:hypothetical protein
VEARRNDESRATTLLPQLTDFNPHFKGTLGSGSCLSRMLMPGAVMARVCSKGLVLSSAFADPPPGCASA